jgi:hypothetical protein
VISLVFRSTKTIEQELEKKKTVGRAKKREKGKEENL